MSCFVATNFAHTQVQHKPVIQHVMPSDRHALPHTFFLANDQTGRNLMRDYDWPVLEAEMFVFSAKSTGNLQQKGNSTKFTKYEADRII